MPLKKEGPRDNHGKTNPYREVERFFAMGEEIAGIDDRARPQERRRDGKQ